MDFSQKVPFFFKAAIVLIGLYVLVIVLVNTREILLPFIYAAIISILLGPIIEHMVGHKINRSIAIAAVLLFTLFIIILILLLLSSQASLLGEAYPRLSAKFQLILKQGVSWISGYFNLSVRSINSWINETQSDLYTNSNAAIGITISALGGILSTLFLTPVYVFMLLFYRHHLIQFIHKLFGSSNESKITEFLSQTKGIIQSYLLGLCFEFLIVATLNSLGLVMLGIDYAILLGIIGALLNIIPYVGGMIAVVLFMIIALLTKAPVYVLYVFIVYLIIQFIDNNFIVPKLIGGKVRLNALISLLAVIGGAAIWGIQGMFLAIPTTAVLKLIFDRMNGLKPWGFLLGDTTPLLLKFKRKISKA
jgi:predicted PurR-regulated permease PerM